jgi:catechol 2,3-dioxygenase-like lactoylglutathione lyase family enzyme
MLTAVDGSCKMPHIDRSRCDRRGEITMSRVQLALNVSDVDAAVAFYSSLFGVAPAKRRPGYANFSVDEPPLKLVLIESPAGGGTLNHLGVEVPTSEEVGAASARLAGLGLPTATEDGVSCCYAVQDKVWVDDPDGAPWEIYTVLADAEEPPGDLRSVDTCGAGTCATTELPADAPSSEEAPATVAGCC